MTYHIGDFIFYKTSTGSLVYNNKYILENPTAFSSAISKEEKNNDAKNTYLKRIFEEDANNKVKLGLIKGIHDIPEVKEYIIEGIIEDVTDLDAIYNSIHERLSSIVTFEKLQGNLSGDTSYPSKEIVKSKETLYVYVTGLTQVTTTLMIFCFRDNIKLTLMFYNNQSNTYFPQFVL